MSSENQESQCNGNHFARQPAGFLPARRFEYCRLPGAPLLAAPPAASIEPAVVNGDLNNVPWQHLLMRPYLVAGIPCFLERHFAGRV